MADSLSFMDSLRHRSHVRWMLVRDLPAVMAIEECSFTEPRDDTDYYFWQKCCSGVVCRVADLGGAVVGLMVYEIQQHHLNVLRVAVHEGFRRKGIGRQLVDDVRAKLRPGRRDAIYLSVHETDLHAQLFFRDVGFRCFGINHCGGGDRYKFAYSPRSPSPVSI